MLLPQYLPTGTFVAVPLSILQSNYYHIHSGFDITTLSTLVPLNIFLAHAIYDWDRKKNLITTEYDRRVKGLYEKTTTAALILASCTLYEENQLKSLIPLLYVLYNFYDELKSSLSILKPFLVSLFWTVAIYVIPVILQEHSLNEDIVTPLSCFCLMSGWSNLADIKDIEEDTEKNILTPATYLKTKNTFLLSSLLIFISFVLNNSSANYDESAMMFDIFNSISLLVFYGLTQFEQNTQR